LQELTNYTEKDNYFYRKLESFGYNFVKPTQDQDKAKLRYFDLLVAYRKDNWRLVDRDEVDFYKVKYQYSRA
jgi:hypothetical protein